MVLLTVCLAAAAPASGQIYSWRDPSGNLVLSNRARPTAPGTAVQSYAVPQAEKVRTTRPSMVERSRAYDELIDAHAQMNGLRADLVRAVVQVESGFNPYATSPKGALGLMQLMPATIHRYGVKNPFNPAENVRAGVAYLKQLLDRYQNNEELALAAYNAGPGAVDRYRQTVPPYRETKQYVAQINQMARRPVQERRKTIYKTTEVVDGRVVSRYSDHKPVSGSFEVLASRE
jgi:soluble lytic murein transglycosylase-like protein